MKNEIGKSLVFIVILIATPLVLFEYYVYWWIWAGNGIFNLIGIPITYLGFMLLHIFMLKKHKQNKNLQVIVKLSMIILTPVLSVSLMFLIGTCFRIDVFNVH